MSDTCATCRFWYVEPPLAIAGHPPVPSLGVCRRYAPVSARAKGKSAIHRTLFPSMFAAESCGEHEPNPPRESAEALLVRYGLTPCRVPVKGSPLPLAEALEAWRRSPC